MVFYAYSSEIYRKFLKMFLEKNKNNYQFAELSLDPNIKYYGNSAFDENHFYTIFEVFDRLGDDLIFFDLVEERKDQSDYKDYGSYRPQGDEKISVEIINLLYSELIFLLDVLNAFGVRTEILEKDNYLHAIKLKKPRRDIISSDLSINSNIINKTKVFSIFEWNEIQTQTRENLISQLRGQYFEIFDDDEDYTLEEDEE